MGQNTSTTGVRYDFTTVSLTGTTAPAFGGVPITFAKGVIQDISYDGMQDAGLVQGNQIAPVGSTNGYGSGTGTLEILASEFDDFMSTITGNGQVPLMSVFFELRVGMSANQTDTRTDTLRGIKITKVSAPHKKGNDAIVRTAELQIKQIFLNGIALFGDPVQ